MGKLTYAKTFKHTQTDGDGGRLVDDDDVRVLMDNLDWRRANRRLVPAQMMKRGHN